MADEENQKVAGHLPAVKAGGMRIVQHKTPNTERPAKDHEDCTGITSPPAVQSANIPNVPPVQYEQHMEKPPNQPNILKDIDKLKHPNSRKTKMLAKKIKQKNNRERQKMGHAIKSNLLGDTLMWFNRRTEDKTEPIKPEEFAGLINIYLERFDEELEQIKMKQMLSKNRSKQHLNRENIIKMTRERESNEFNTCGIEMMDLCDRHSFDAFKKWDGNAVNIQHLKFKRISNKYLQNLKNSKMLDTN